MIYEATANAYAPLQSGSGITNTATASGCDGSGSSTTVTVRDNAELSIAKSMCPEQVNCGGEITYTFIIQNSGNIPVIATDNLIVSDTFTPPLADVTVTLNGVTLTEGTGYTYDPVTGAFATLNGAVTVPAATFTIDPQTGNYVTTPGTATLVVEGTI